MAKPFLSDTFLLENDPAVELYQRFARDLPIIDYHCHLPPAEIAGDVRFPTITRIWLAGDHYKWRAMRTNGVPEHLITGDASDRDKFFAWARTVPATIRNPLYHWTHMELQRPFGLTDVLLDGNTAQRVWDHCNACLQLPAFSTRGILRQMRVEVVCTTDDPIDALVPHRDLRDDPTAGVRVLPAFRADRVLNIDAGVQFLGYIRSLGEAAGVEIRSYQDLLDALRRRHAYFHRHGCRLSDHGIETAFVEPCTEKEADTIFRHALTGTIPDPEQALKFKSAVLYELCLMDHAAGWVQQFHLGAVRNINRRMYRTLGPDTGYDFIGDFPILLPIARLLARLDDEDRLARTIIYPINPADLDAVATLIGCFQDGTVPGKIQLGSAWWFLDQLDGIERQLDALSNMGLLSRFVGMLTDSRSFLSYPRHDYFRRVLCNLLGGEMERGLIPCDMNLVGGIVADISYYNARRYFDFFGGSQPAG